MSGIYDTFWDVDSNDPVAGNDLIADYLASDGDPNACSADGVSLLHLAAVKGFPGVVDMLLRAGARVNIRTGSGDPHEHWLEGSPLQVAVEFKDEHIVAMLLKQGADPVMRSAAGDNPFLVAAMNGNVKIGMLLLNAGADINCRATPTQPKSTYILGETALHIAARYLNVSFVKFLISKGANLDIRDDQGRTALDLVSTGDFKYQGLGPFPQKEFDEIRGAVRGHAGGGAARGHA